MGAYFQDFWQKFVWNASKKDVGPTYDLKGTHAWAKIFGDFDDFANERVSERRAHQLSTVYTCINVRSQTVASLPINIIREKNGKKEVLTDHPAYELLAHQPNNFMSSANMEMTSVIHADSWGNSIIGVDRDAFERPTKFYLIPADEWVAEVIEGDAWYTINGMTVPARDVIHYRYWSLDGLNGISPIRQNAITMGKALKMERYSAMAVGKVPPGILSYEGEMRPEAKAENQKTWERDIEIGKTPILSGRWQYQNILLSPDDVQYIETEGMTDQKIYGIFRVPPVFAQNYMRATWKNAEESDLIFAKHTITPIVRVREQELNMKLFTEREKKNTYVKYNMNGLLRGDISARANFYTAMKNVGAINANEIRDKEDMNSYEGGEIYTTQGANIPVDQLRDFYSKEVLPGADENQKRDEKDKKYHMNGHSKILN